MTHQTPPLTADDIPDFDFAPVAMTRNRHDGWVPERQRMFLKALSVTGSVEAAAKMVQMSRKSAYALRNRSNAESFARAWDIAIGTGRARIYDYMFDRAINGVTTITLKMGGAVELSHGLDSHLVAMQMKAPPPDRRSADGHKGDIR